MKIDENRNNLIQIRPLGIINEQKNNKPKFRITREQMDRLKILETLETFQNAVVDFRKKFSMTIPKGSFGSFSPEKITPLEYWDKVERELSVVAEKFKLSFSLAETQVLFYIKHNQWGFDPSLPKEFFEPTLLAPVNYDIRNTPIAKMDKSFKVIEYSKEVSLVTYARLSIEEEKEALKLLKARQKLVFDPKLTKQLRRKKDIGRDIAVEKEMEKREPKHREEKLTGYLKSAKREFDKGLTTTQKFTALKKNRPQEVEIIETGKTSKDIAQKMLGNKKHAPNARQMVLRMKKKREKMFGNL